MYTSKLLSHRTDGIGLGARLDSIYPDIEGHGSFMLSFRGMKIPYQKLGTVKRINIGTVKQKEALPLIQSDLTVVTKRSKAVAFVTMTLFNFEIGSQIVPVGRPIALGIYDQVGDKPAMRSDFGSSPYTYEAFDMLSLSANEKTGETELRGKIWQENDWISLTDSTHASSVCNPENDAYRFGNACLQAISVTSRQPLIKELSQ